MDQDFSHLKPETPMQRTRMLVGIIGIGIAVVSSAAFGAAPSSASAPDLDIGAVEAEGTELASKSKAVQEKLDSLADEEEQIQSQKMDSKKELADYEAQSKAFAAKCGHDLVQGQESLVAQCQREQAENLQTLQRLTRTQKAVIAALSDWKQRKSAADQQKTDLALKFSSWEHRMRALLILARDTKCINAVDAQSADAVDYNTMLSVVHGYQRCIDGSPQLGPRTPEKESSGTPAFGRPTRTPQQAIEEYKKSGKPNSELGPHKRLDGDKVPPPPPAS